MKRQNINGKVRGCRYQLKRPYVCVVASAFEATITNMMFGYVKNVI
jgi:hypothetical protein